MPKWLGKVIPRQRRWTGPWPLFPDTSLSPGISPVMCYWQPRLSAPQLASHLSPPQQPHCSPLQSQNDNEGRQQEVSVTIAAEEPCWAWQIRAKIPLA